MATSILSISDPRWLAFAAGQAQASAFHHPAWASMLAECYGYRPSVVTVADAAGEVLAGLPILEVKSRLTGSRAVALPFTDFCPPLGGEDTATVLIGEIEAQVRAGSWPRVEVRWPLPARPGIYPGAAVAHHVTPLSSDPDQVWSRIRGSARRLIRQAEKADVEITQGQDWRDVRSFYDLHLMTRRRQGAPVQPLRFFRLLWDYLLSTGLGFLFLARKDRQPIAGAIFLSWNRTLIYKYGASLPSFWSLRPNNLLFWSALRWGSEHGYERFDWGRTDLEDQGLRSFKLGWGSEESIVTYSLVAQRPPSSAPSGRRRYLSAVIQRSPTWVGRAIGELLYGSFG